MSTINTNLRSLIHNRITFSVEEKQRVYVQDLASLKAKAALRGVGMSGVAIAGFRKRSVEYIGEASQAAWEAARAALDESRVFYADDLGSQIAEILDGQIKHIFIVAEGAFHQTIGTRMHSSEGSDHLRQEMRRQQANVRTGIQLYVLGLEQEQRARASDAQGGIKWEKISAIGTVVGVILAIIVAMVGC